MVGEREVFEGPGLIVKLELAEMPPPGVGLYTDTWAVPAVAISVAEMAARNCDALTKVVVRADPFHLIAEVLTNPLPLTVRVKVAAPAVAPEGDREVIDGTGLEILMTLPVPVSAALVPSDIAAERLDSDNWTELEAAASVTLTVATMPLFMALEFRP